MSIELSNIRKAFDRKVILDGVSLEVRDGETLAVIGYSGAGKSVLLKTIVGLIAPDAGHVLVDGEDVAALPRERLYALRRRIGYVFQGAALFDSMTAFDNVAMGLRRQRLPEPAVAERVAEALGRVELEGMGGRRPGELSGGQKKRVGLARAIAAGPDYLLYDEPTTGLDPVTTAVIDRLILKLAGELKVTSMLITHDMTSAYRVADRIALLDGGRIHFIGTPAEVRATSDPLLRGFVEGRPELVRQAVA